MGKFIKLTDRVGETVLVNTRYVILVEDLTGCDKPTDTGVIYAAGSERATLFVRESVTQVYRLILGYT